MKYLKITLSIIGILAFSQSYAQDIDAKVEKRFSKIDSNSDESVSLEELTAFYKGKTNKQGDAFDAEKIFTRKDANEDGGLTLEEFAAKGKKKVKAKKKNKKKY